jgi:hypothetical protein
MQVKTQWEKRQSKGGKLPRWAVNEKATRNTRNGRLNNETK